MDQALLVVEVVNVDTDFELAKALTKKPLLTDNDSDDVYMKKARLRPVMHGMAKQISPLPICANPMKYHPAQLPHGKKRYMPPLCAK